MDPTFYLYRKYKNNISNYQYYITLGGVNLNNKLSEVRAKAVKKILVNAGIPENKIEVKWYGKSRFKEFKYSSKSEYRRVILSVK